MSHVSPSASQKSGFKGSQRVSEGFEFCLLEGWRIFYVPVCWIDGPRSPRIRRLASRRSLTVDRDRPSGASTFPFCEGLGPSVLLALLQPGVEIGPHALMRR